MWKKAEQFPFPCLIIFFVFLQIISVGVIGSTDLSDHREEEIWRVGSVVRRDERRSLVSTEYGEISAVEISDGAIGRYHLQFITLEPNALLLPVLLHADMVFYVKTGSGRLIWVDEDEKRTVNLRQGDVYRLQPGTAFSVQSNLEAERQKLRIYALFTNSIEDLQEPSMGRYSSIRDLILGFDKKVLQAAFNVPEEVIEEITSGPTMPAIVHAEPKKGRTFWEFETQFMKGLLGSKGYSMFDLENKKRKIKTFNILKADKDFENCNGWSLMVTKKNLPALRGSNIGLLMVNLTKGSMMGPHWNPMATEISIVIEGGGMVHVVCSSTMDESECKNMRFRVEEGDVFAVPRFHPMAQMAFNNGSLVFMGFSTSTKKNHPQFLAGKASVLQTLDRQVMAVSFNVTNTTISQLMDSQRESIILDCTSCAEEEERMMLEEIEKKKEEARKREEEETRKREEEKRREAEEARKREEEEARRKEEEKRRREEEEEAREREEEARREEEKRRREEEEARKREEEEEARREEEEEEARREEREREKEEEETRRQEAAKREEEEARKEEEARRQEQEREEMEKQQEDERREREKQQQEEAKRQEEEEEEQQEEKERSTEGEGEGEQIRFLKKIWKV
ncbi:Vicilin-like seed storage protein [Actinidia chinensis var. chinensis]|uniref:Vicilin-like seed storage protein n=1 Tax=Actinidia chinensis var. chinensis TaxID=1590841 RepID=A0A2R6S2F2_ACTCC|nr:Vicilin-like seed storage protein [Actinidia chinensis var. chinensis]